MERNAHQPAGSALVAVPWPNTEDRAGCEEQALLRPLQATPLMGRVQSVVLDKLSLGMWLV